MNTINASLTTTTNRRKFRLGIFKDNALFSLLNPDIFFVKKIFSLVLKLEGIKWKKRLYTAGVYNADEIYTHTTSSELRALYNLASNCPQGATVLEIGSYLGASSCYIAAGLAQVNGHLFCVDTWQNETMPEGEQDTFTEFQKNTNGVKRYITPVRKRSVEVSSQDIKFPLSLVFIDGDHSYEAVKSDFNIVQQWLAEDGIIAFHDFSTPDYQGVTRVVGEALASGNWKIVGYVDTLVWIKQEKWNKPAWVK